MWELLVRPVSKKMVQKAAAGRDDWLRFSLGCYHQDSNRRSCLAIHPAASAFSIGLSFLKPV